MFDLIQCSPQTGSHSHPSLMVPQVDMMTAFGVSEHVQQEHMGFYSCWTEFNPNKLSKISKELLL